MEFKSIAVALKRFWWVIVLAVVVGGVAGALLTFTQEKQYTASATLFVAASGGTSATEAYQNDQFSQQRAASYARLVSSEQVMNRVIEDLHLEMSEQELSASVSATIVPRTVLVELSAVNSNPQLAADIANSVSAQFIGYMRQLETPVGEKSPRSVITEVSRAAVPSSPSAPKVSTFAFYGSLAGLLIGLVLVALLSWLKNRPSSRADLAEATGVPSFGPLDVASGADKSIDQLATGDGFDNYRRLRAQIDAGSESSRVIVITGSTDRAPTARFADYLGLAYAEHGRATVLVDMTDEHVDVVPEGSSRRSSHNAGERLDHQSVVDAGYPNLYAADLAGRELEPLAASSQMRAFLDETKAQAVVVVAVPAVASSSIAVVLAPAADDLLVLVEQGVVPRATVVSAVRDLRESGNTSVRAILVHPVD